MKDKAALVIAVLMVTSIAFAVSTTSATSTTSVTAPSKTSVASASSATALPIFSASHGSASMTPSMVGGNKWVILTFSVTNDTDSEIFKITVRDEPENKWDEPMGGHWYAVGDGGFSVAENWDNVADNLSAAGTKLSRVADNLEEALAAKQAAGVDFAYAAENLDDAGEYLNSSDNTEVKRAGFAIRTAADHLKEAASLLQSEPENLLLIATWIENATGTGSLAENFQRAADNLTSLAGANHSLNDNRLVAAGENLGMALGMGADENGWFLDNAAEELSWGHFKMAGYLIENAATYVKEAGENLVTVGNAIADGDMVDGGNLLKTQVYTNLLDMAHHLENMAENIREAGLALGSMVGYTNGENYFYYAENIYVDNDKTRFDYLGANFIEAIDNAADALTADNENVLKAGDELKEAALALDAIQRDNLIELGSRYLGTRSDSVDNMLYNAGDNLADRERLNITTAVSGIDNVATKLENAATKLKATAALLEPNHWSVKEPHAEPCVGDVELEAENFVYQIAPGSSKTFVFLWKAPNVGGDYTFKLHYEDNAGTTIDKIDTVTISVDVTVPRVVTFKVTQTGGIENIVGNVRDNGKAKITLVASEAIQELADAYIENIGNAENLLPKIVQADWTTTDNITFEYEFTVGAWDDNTLQPK